MTEKKYVSAFKHPLRREAYGSLKVVYSEWEGSSYTGSTYTGSSYTWSNTQKFSCGLQIPNSTRYACDRGNHRWSPKVNNGSHGISTGLTAGVLNGHQ